MKILIISQYFWPENFKINDIALGLKELGHEVSVLTGIPNYPLGVFIKVMLLKVVMKNGIISKYTDRNSFQEEKEE